MTTVFNKTHLLKCFLGTSGTVGLTVDDELVLLAY